MLPWLLRALKPDLQHFTAVHSRPGWETTVCPTYQSKPLINHQNEAVKSEDGPSQTRCDNKDTTDTYSEQISEASRSTASPFNTCSPRKSTARRRIEPIASTDSRSRTRTLQRLSSALLTWKDGFSVVAPIRVIVPHSTWGKKVSWDENRGDMGGQEKIPYTPKVQNYQRWVRSTVKMTVSWKSKIG